MLAHQRPPEEGHQLLAARFRRFGPEPFVDGLIFDARALAQRRFQDGEVEAAKDLLDTRAVECDKDDGERSRLLCCDGQRQAERNQGSEDPDHSTA